MLRRVFTRAGHEVTEAGDGAAALAAVQQSPPDLVVTDI
jgi:CheY-like chemotaxis protein